MARNLDQCDSICIERSTRNIRKMSESKEV